MKNKDSNRVRPLLFNAAISGVSPKSRVTIRPIQLDTSQGFEVPLPEDNRIFSSTPTTPNIIENKRSIKAGMAADYDISFMPTSPRFEIGGI
jgi:hypothetical protein